MKTREFLKNENYNVVYMFAKDYYNFALKKYQRAIEEKDDRALIESLWSFKDAFEAADVFLDKYEPLDKNDGWYESAQKIYRDCFEKIKKYRITINGKEVA